MLGRYEVKHVLGQGATSTVYLAYDPVMQCDVAIKVAAPDSASDKHTLEYCWSPIVSEAQLAGKFDHPNIASIYDYALFPDRAFIVMEYVPGPALEKFCTPSTLLPLESVVDIAAQCARGLNYVSTLGVTHCDIKPTNILFLQSRICCHIKIIDFGNAIIGKASDLMIKGVGSPAYMSPEQICGTALDQRADIYSLGAVMYQMVTGQLLCRCESGHQAESQLLSSAPLRPSVLRPDLPSDIEECILRATAKSRDQRYANWSEFLRGLPLHYGSGASYA